MNIIMLSAKLFLIKVILDTVYRYVFKRLELFINFIILQSQCNYQVLFTLIIVLFTLI